MTFLFAGLFCILHSWYSIQMDIQMVLWQRWWGRQNTKGSTNCCLIIQIHIDSIRLGFNLEKKTTDSESSFRFYFVTVWLRWNWINEWHIRNRNLPGPDACYADHTIHWTHSIDHQDRRNQHLAIGYKNTTSVNHNPFGLEWNRKQKKNVKKNKISLAATVIGELHFIAARMKRCLLEASQKHDYCRQWNLYRLNVSRTLRDCWFSSFFQLLLLFAKRKSSNNKILTDIVRSKRHGIFTFYVSFIYLLLKKMRAGKLPGSFTSMKQI